MDQENANNDTNVFEPEVNLGDDFQRELDEALGDMGLSSIMDMDQAPCDASASATGVRRGEVIGIHGEDIFVDLGGKDQGLLSAKQFEDTPLPNVGDIIEFAVTGYDREDGLLLLSRQGAVMAATWESLEKGQILEGRVTGCNKGGLELIIDGIEAFMPISQVELSRVDSEELKSFVNRRLRCEVMEIRRSEKTVVVSHRAVLAQEAAEAGEKTFASLVEGDTVNGTVRTIMPYGAFVDLGGVDGLLHVSDMSYSRVSDPKEIVQEGQKLQVVILKVDQDNRKISLGLKQILPDPWTDAASAWPEGTTVSGRVTRLEGFGAFVELTEGVEGLVPISEMSFERRIRHPSEVANVGDVIKVRVLSIDLERKRISLSIKQVGDDPWTGASARWPENSLVEGVVTRITEFGAFVELTAGVEGLVHISELSEERVRSVNEVVSEGQKVQAKVLSVDEDGRRISLSIKEVVTMPEYTTSPTEEPEPEKPPRKRKKPLKGGLDHGFFG